MHCTMQLSFQGKLLACDDEAKLVLRAQQELISSSDSSKGTWELVNGSLKNKFNGRFLQLERNTQSVRVSGQEPHKASRWTLTNEGVIHLAFDCKLCLCWTNDEKLEVRYFPTAKDVFRWAISDPTPTHVYQPLSTVSNHGYPTPGPQDVTASSAMEAAFFVPKEEWDSLRRSEFFDYIVIGSGFCSFAFVNRTLTNNPFARILILERGDYFLPDHFMNLHSSFGQIASKPGVTETFPWSVSKKTADGEYIKWLHGQVPYLGGKSTMWTGWCPKPQNEDLRGWPPELIATLSKYFDEAATILNVKSASEIFAEKDIGVMQKMTLELLEENLPTVQRIIPAPLSIDDTNIKYSSIVPNMLNLIEQQKAKCSCGKGWVVKLSTNCVVQKILEINGKAFALQTSRGEVKMGSAKVILAMGALPSTTIIMNSFPYQKFPKLSSVGKRFSAHFISKIIARIPRLSVPKPLEKFEIGAVYIAGIDDKSDAQYHIQLSFVTDVEGVLQHRPIIVDMPSATQLKGSQEHVIFVCSTLGELDDQNKENWFRLKKNTTEDITANGELQATLNQTDCDIWDTMDEATFKVLEQGLSVSDNSIEYWNGVQWQPSRPKQSQIRNKALVHEGSTMWIGNDDDQAAPVGLDYRPRGIENVYITGGALKPTGGSWNPTLTLMALAVHLADQLSKTKASKL